MTIQEFIDKYIGLNGIDFDGAYGKQCVDLFRAYHRDMIGGTQPRGVKGAKDFWSNYETDPALNKNYKKIVNTLDFVPIPGDVMIWSNGEFGHIAIVTKKGNLKNFESIDQNWKNKRQIAIVTHTYGYVYGVLRPNDIIESGNNPDMPTDIRLKILDESGIKNESQVREAVARSKGWEGLQNDKRNADIKIDLLQDENKKYKSDLQAERDANVARVNAEKEQNRNLLKSIGEATGANQSLPEILQAISILRSAEQGKDKAERAEKQAREELASEKLRASEIADKLQNMTSLLKDREKELKDLLSTVKRLTLSNNKNNMAKKKLNPVLEALKEPLRLAVLALIPFGVSYFAGMDYAWAGVITVLLRAVDKYLHKAGKQALPF